MDLWISEKAISRLYYHILVQSINMLNIICILIFPFFTYFEKLKICLRCLKMTSNRQHIKMDKKKITESQKVIRRTQST